MSHQRNQYQLTSPSFAPIYSEETAKKISEDFPHLKEKSITYLDSAAAGLYSKSQMDQVHQDLLSNVYCNPHTSGNFGNIRDVKENVREMRHRILSHFNTTDQIYKVIFTSGATASCKLLAECFPLSTNDSTFMYLDECHTSVIGMRELSNNFEVINEKNVNSKLFCDSKTNFNLFAFPAMSNFCGKKFPCKKWIQMSKVGSSSHNNNQKWYVLLDAASYVSTNPLNLDDIQPDFVCISFYKIFGYPTGIGALLVKCSALSSLKKNYFGGGTVDMNLVQQKIHVPKSSSPEGNLVSSLIIKSL